MTTAPLQALLEMAPQPDILRWLGGTPDAGSTGLLAYNKASGQRTRRAWQCMAPHGPAVAKHWPRMSAAAQFCTA